MAGKKDYESRAEELLQPIAEAHQVSIYDVEYVKEGKEWYLRAYIDKPGGVNINDCENVSREFSTALDQEDLIQDAYILEVSSPGLGRQLKKDRHLQNSIGEEVIVKLYEAENGQKELTGTLQTFDKKVIVITDEDNQERQIERNKIAQIRLTLDF
ncbi:MAG: ribosome maturation factor RimP [Lachnospiraceae bacterium]|nr:ribosome maturation factor RimP [Roseburia sp.]MBP3468717.1 ribosome maturation factor RimP [Lachnospiraceae bacterium]